ncbi:putative aconitate hydratase [Colletotrichum tropicale]|nr:putative aconitate hydratase [Colletotrichum tropicale]
MYLHASRPLAGLSRGSPHMRHVGLRRGLASVSSASSKARLSRFETDHTIDYADLTRRIESSRKILGRPLTYSEKVLFAHADNIGDEPLHRGKTQLQLRPRRIACQDATAQMAIIQFMSAGLDSTAVPTTVHCDHLIVGRTGQDEDLPQALSTHKEVYDFLSSACKRYGMGFWKPGAGIIHQTVLENYAFPGGMMDMEKGVKNSILTSYNRNFTGRLDGNPATHIFLASPEMVMAKIFSDDLSFNPTSDSIVTPSGSDFRFKPPGGEALPSHGYANTDYVYSPPPSTGRNEVEVQIAETSKRLQRLAPFEPWHGKDFENCAILIKVQGKCTTDHITPAGPWFAYRGHLGNISNNTLIGAVNAETGKVNQVKNWLTGEDGDVPGTARAYKEASQPWVVIGDHNYGEGSSREHAALQPRYLGCVAIMAKSFARIHETNLKKQGLLALKFVKESDYERISSSDRISIMGIKDLQPGENVEVKITPTTAGRERFSIELSHTLTNEQFEYFREGSALNLMAKRKQANEISL